MKPEALHSIGYGLYVVCSKKGKKYNAQIANTLFQITSEPPTIAVSINKNNLTHEYIEASGVYTATVLCQDTPLSFIGNFGFKSGRDVDKLKGIEYRMGSTGVPVVTENGVACFEVKVTQQVDVGTHTLFIGEVVDADVLSHEVCMTYVHYHEVKRGTTPKSAPTYIAENGGKK
jgi:flavin reductase (DIM6/NTAB) family NADH-FMN oxidoreductase RutF